MRINEINYFIFAFGISTISKSTKTLYRIKKQFTGFSNRNKTHIQFLHQRHPKEKVLTFYPYYLVIFYLLQPKTKILKHFFLILTSINKGVISLKTFFYFKNHWISSIYFFWIIFFYFIIDSCLQDTYLFLSLHPQWRWYKNKFAKMALWRNWIAHLITAQEVTGLNPVKVTLKLKTPLKMGFFYAYTRNIHDIYPTLSTIILLPAYPFWF